MKEMMRKRNKHRWLSTLLMLCIVLVMMPMTVFALEPKPTITWNGDTVQWTAVPGAVTYRVILGGRDMETYENKDWDASVLSREFKNILLPGNTYRVRVLSLDADGQRVADDASSVRTIEGSRQPAPTITWVADEDRVTWTEVPGADVLNLLC